LSLLHISVRAKHDPPLDSSRCALHRSGLRRQLAAKHPGSRFSGRLHHHIRGSERCVPSFLLYFRFAIFVHATRRVSQLSAILLHQEQAGEIAKTQLLCARMPLPRSEQKPWQTSSKLGGCSFARVCLYCAVEKLMHQRPNPISLFFQREMARIEKIELRAGDISF